MKGDKMTKHKRQQLDYVVEVYLDDKWQIVFTSDDKFAAEKFWNAQLANGNKARISNQGQTQF